MLTTMHLSERQIAIVSALIYGCKGPRSVSDWIGTEVDVTQEEIDYMKSLFDK